MIFFVECDSRDRKFNNKTERKGKKRHHVHCLFWLNDFIYFSFQSITLYRDKYFLFPAPIRNIFFASSLSPKAFCRYFFQENLFSYTVKLYITVKGSCSHTQSSTFKLISFVWSWHLFLLVLYMTPLSFILNWVPCLKEFLCNSASSSLVYFSVFPGDIENPCNHLLLCFPNSHLILKRPVMEYLIGVGSKPTCSVYFKATYRHEFYFFQYWRSDRTQKAVIQQSLC